MKETGIKRKKQFILQTLHTWLCKSKGN